MSVETRVHLGAYQTLVLEDGPNHEQWTCSGDAPRTLTGVLTTAMDEPFVNRSVTVILTEEAQRELIAVLQNNLERGR